MLRSFYSFKEMDIDFAGKSKDDMFRMPLIKVGKTFHGVYGEANITKSRIREFVQNAGDEMINLNFDHNPQLSVAKTPESQISAGEFKVDKFDEKSGILWAMVSFTERAFNFIKSGEFKFISPEFSFKWLDKSTGKTRTDGKIFGAALTNTPHLDMPNVKDINKLKQENQVKPNQGENMEGLLKMLHASSEVEAVQGLTKLNNKLQDLEEKVKLYSGQLPKEGQVVVDAKHYNEMVFQADQIKKDKLEANEKMFADLISACVENQTIKPSEKEYYRSHFFTSEDKMEISEFVLKTLKDKAGQKPEVGPRGNGASHGAKEKMADEMSFNDAYEAIAKRENTDDFDLILNKIREEHLDIYCDHFGYEKKHFTNKEEVI